LLKFGPAVIIDGTAYSAAGPTPDRVFVPALDFSSQGQRYDTIIINMISKA
jgi:hypothetical protein